MNGPVPDGARGVIGVGGELVWGMADHPWPEGNPTAAVSWGCPAEGHPEPLLSRGQIARSVCRRTSRLGSYEHPRSRKRKEIYHTPNGRLVGHV